MRGLLTGWIADFAYETAPRKLSGGKPVFGVNILVEADEEPAVETHAYDQSTAERQIARTRRARAERDQGKVEHLLGELVEVAKDETWNLMPVNIELVREGATMGDIVERLKTDWGTYGETPVF